MGSHAAAAAAGPRAASAAVNLTHKHKKNTKGRGAQQLARRLLGATPRGSSPCNTIGFTRVNGAVKPNIQ